MIEFSFLVNYPFKHIFDANIFPFTHFQLCILFYPKRTKQHHQCTSASIFLIVYVKQKLEQIK